MTARKIHEMAFALFAQAIVPSCGWHLADPMRTPSDRLAWLASVWNRAEKKKLLSISWRNGVLNQMLPPEARQYRFEDSQLHGPALALGLDPTDGADLSKVAELLATCNAWRSAVTLHCRDRAAEGLPEQLAPQVLNDFVRLSCHWMRHPWVQESVSQHQKSRQLSKLTQARGVDEDSKKSINPRWPDATVIYARAPDLTPQQVAVEQAKKNSIDYWIKNFDFDNSKYSSQFEMIAWDAKDDIDVAHLKIQGLLELVEVQRALIPGLQRTQLKNQRLDAKVNGRSQAGRPKQSLQRQEVARQFTVQWVQSLMAVLNAPNGVALEAMVSKSSQRNWRRWLAGESVPSARIFAQLEGAKITFGPLQGQRLSDIDTTPGCGDLLRLLRLSGMTRH